MKILLGVNVLDSVNAAVYLSHLSLMGYTKGKYPDSKIFLFTPERMSIDRMRNEAAKMALQYECDYLMFIDDDVVVEPNALESLLEADKDIIMAETYVRGYPFNAMWFKNQGEGLVHYNDFQGQEDANGLIKCDAVGFSCVLIKTSLLRKLSTPYFITGPNFTEDVYFCVKAQRELGEDGVSIYVDTKVPTGHTLSHQFVHRDNVQFWKQFCESAYPGICAPQPDILRKDRPKEYAAVVEQLFSEE